MHTRGGARRPYGGQVPARQHPGRIGPGGVRQDAHHGDPGAVTKATRSSSLDLPGIVGPEHYRNPTHASKVSGAWAAVADHDTHCRAHRQVTTDVRIPVFSRRRERTSRRSSTRT